MLKHFSVHNQLKMKVTDSHLHRESMGKKGGKENAVLLFGV